MLAVVILITTAGVFLVKSSVKNQLTGQTFLASVFNNKESYDDVFLKLSKTEEIADAKAGVVSHHFLAKELIANFYNKIGNNDISTVFLISPDHYNVFLPENTIAYTSYLPWHTPFGDLETNKEGIDYLISRTDMQQNDSAMGLEHGIYVEVPFIKKFFPNAKIVPIVTKGSHSYDIFSSLGKDIEDKFGKKAILIVSSDFSHNATVKEAGINDKESIQALKNLNVDNINKVTNDCKQCLAVLSGFLGDDKKYDFSLIDNKNSFDISLQNGNSVTSYVSGYYTNKDYVQILFTGDLMFDRGIRYFGQKNGNEFVFDKIYNLLINNDLVISNLEGPVTNEKSISSGTVPGSPNNYYFTFPADLPQTLFRENIQLVNLGNNHILNFGQKGLKSTKDYLSKLNIEYFGEPHGKRSVIKEIGGLKIAFVGYNEFASNDIEAEQNSTIQEIKKNKSLVNIVIVFSHWGAEYIKEPSSSIKELAHGFVDAGADIVIGSHSHVTGSVEEYNGKKIYYSLGNFVFDQYFDEDVRRGLGVIIKIDKQTKKLDFIEKKFYLQNNGQTILSE